MAKPNYGFKDVRNAAELMLAPGIPLSRVVIKKIPTGIIGKITQITGAVRNDAAAAMAAKRLASEMQSTVTSTLAQFDALKKNFKPGMLMPPIPLPSIPSILSIPLPPIPPIPTAASFMNFSQLRPGSPIPGNFLATMNMRRSQLQSMKTRLSKLKTKAEGLAGGVSITENTARTPYPLKDELDRPLGSRQSIGGAIAQADPISKDKAKFLASGITTAAGKPKTWSRLVTLAKIKASPLYNPATNTMFNDRGGSGGWSEPASPAAPQSPYNKATQTESGHLFELDDTPGAERIHIFHRSGSFIEWHPNGTVVYKNMKDGVLITTNNQFVNIKGLCNITVEGNASMYVKGKVDIQSDDEVNINTKKDFNVHADNINLRAKKTFKGDGKIVDLRYIVLPAGLAVVISPPNIVPRINVAAITADFPTFNPASILSYAALKPLDASGIAAKLKLPTSTVVTPLEIALGNPLAYIKKTPAAVNYRALFFDTPEETEATDVYTAHCDIQRTLKDITSATDPRALSGSVGTLDTTMPPGNLDIDYLNFDDYSGNFNISASRKLGNTAFTVGDIDDSVLYAALLL